MLDAEEITPRLFHGHVHFREHVCTVTEAAPDLCLAYIDQFTEIPELDSTRFIGEGSAASVYQAQYNSRDVAVKVMNLQNIESGQTFITTFFRKLTEVMNEIRVMVDCRSQYIVEFVGACHDPLQIVMEYCDNGTLTSYLHHQGNVVDVETGLKFAYQIAKGVSLLHHKGIVHRDIKSPNILMHGEPPACVLSDFGLSAEEDLNETPLVDNPRWLAPEILAGNGHFTLPCDIYALGVVFWEIVARRLPFDKSDFVVELVHRILEGERPSPASCQLASFQRIYESCWDGNPLARPSIDQVVEMLRECIQAREWEHPSPL